MSISGRGRVGRPAAVVLLVGVLGAGILAVVSRPSGAPAATWWPAVGIAVSLLALTPRRWWTVLIPGVMLATGLANVLAGRSVELSLWFAVANALEALVVASILRRGRDTLPDLTTLEALMRLTIGAVLGALAFTTVASVGVATLAGAPYVATWRALLISHAASVLIIVPLVMAPVGRVTRRFAWELPIQIAALVAVTVLVFGPRQTLSLEFLPLPLLLWAALRFDVRTVVWELFGFAVATTLMSQLGHGPFGFDHERGGLTAVGMGAVVQAYVLVATLMSLPLAIGVEQRRRLLEQVSSNAQLFRRNFTESLVGMLLLRSGETLLEIVDLNDAAARILGDPDAALGHGLGEVLDTREPLSLISDRILSGNLAGWRAQTGVRSRPGTRLNVALSLLSPGPEPTFAAQLLDVTREHDARRRLEAAEKLTSATLDTTAAMIMVTDLYGVVARVNGATTAITGFDEDELVGVEIWDMPFASPGSSGYPAGLPERPGEQVSRETDVLTKGGGKRRVLWNTSYVRDEHDRPTYVVLTGTDLTAERTAAGLNRHLLEAAITTAMIGIDPRGRVTLFNAGAVNLLGHDAQDTVGTPFVELLDQDEVAERCGVTGEAAFARLVAGLGGGGETAPRDWTWIGSDGRRHIVSMTVSVAADAFAARVGYLCVGRDVTEARASQEMLVAALEKERHAVQRMREVDAAKNEFVSTVSHELRTPVTSIVGYTEILEDGSVVAPVAEQKPLLESIARNGRRLILLCDDLLLLSGLDSGATQWERDAVDLAAVVAGAEDAIGPQLGGRDLRMDVRTGAAPVPVVGDRAQLERVVTNLLGNAVKFTEDGGRVEVAVEGRDGEAWLTVSDTGIGIPVEEQQGLFQRFFRSSTAKERAIQGTGLGLSIVAAVVAAHGGRIDVRSAHLEGTTFTVRLPLAR